jgi:pimeloyl-ACP methyl ester carboxylesterase
VVLVAIGTAFLAPSAGAAAPGCEDGPQPTGAVYRICMPDSWNGDLVLWAHGYVDPQEPVEIPEGQLTLPDGASLPDIVNGLDYAFATTSYRDNGLVVPLAVNDLLDLVSIFEDRHGTPNRTFIIGASEGGLITTLSLEKHPDVFDGGIAACGPVGDFPTQVNHFGDFRVIFDYFYPGILPGDTASVPQEVIDNWDSVYEPAIISAIQSDPNAIRQLLTVTRAPFDPGDLNTVIETVRGLLWYNVHATNDGIAKLGGQPFDNRTKIYRGSDNDFLLNWGVKRFSADPAALAEITANYQTSGKLDVPLITLHTKGDPIVPYVHEGLYTWKTIAAGKWLMHINVPIDRYGHCQFQAEEALASFFLLQILVTLHG